MTTTMSTKGQIVIPNELRERKNLHPGDELDIEERAEGLLIRKKRRNEGLAALLRACPVKGFMPKHRPKHYPRNSPKF